MSNIKDNSLDSDSPGQQRKPNGLNINITWLSFLFTIISAIPTVLSFIFNAKFLYILISVLFFSIFVYFINLRREIKNLRFIVVFYLLLFVVILILGYVPLKLDPIHLPFSREVLDDAYHFPETTSASSVIQTPNINAEYSPTPTTNKTPDVPNIMVSPRLDDEGSNCNGEFEVGIKRFPGKFYAAYLYRFNPNNKKAILI